MKTQSGGGGHLVDILSARSARAAKFLDYLIFTDMNVFA